MKLPTKEFRAKVAHLRAENQKASSFFKAVPHEVLAMKQMQSGRTRSPSQVWRNNKYLVTQWECSPYLRLSICRTMIDEHGHWLADIGWEDMQAIKSSLGFGDRLAVEIFPRDDDVVNVANMRHLWIFPNGEVLPFGWGVGLTGDVRTSSDAP
jgi:hypothetical protein